MRKDFGKKTIITPLPVVIIGTYDENGVPNAMNAAWAGQVDTDQIIISLAKHKTTDNLERCGEFTVSFATADTVTASDYFGIETGRKVNKIEKAGCHTHPSSRVNAPIIEEYPLTLECRMTSWDPGSGRMIGEIVSQQADESILTDGRVDVDKLKPIIFDPASHAYRVIGKVVGRAYSDGKQLMK
jgi:flavin reductase (DIM6/NTAB) family NADH-FMN oxidoreductase RutF